MTHECIVRYYHRMLCDCLSVKLMIYGHIGWANSKVLTRESFLRAPRRTSQNFGWNRGGICKSSCIS